MTGLDHRMIVKAVTAPSMPASGTVTGTDEVGLEAVIKKEAEASFFLVDNSVD